MLQLIDIKHEIDRHIKRIDAILPDIQNWLPLEKQDFDDTEKVTTIDSINLSITTYLKMKKVYTEMLNATGVC
jgi:hypothetical protein